MFNSQENCNNVSLGPLYLQNPEKIQDIIDFTYILEHTKGELKQRSSIREAIYSHF